MITSLPQALEQTACRYPDHEALHYRGQRLTYTVLQQHATSLAWHLRQQGVQRGDRVGLYMPKSLEAVIALYGIMQAGAAYVPLDPFAPVARLGQIIKDCAIRCLISTATHTPQVHQLLAEVPLTCLVEVQPPPGGPVHCVPWQTVLDTAPGAAPDVLIDEHDLAYILYTSGSTGTPKGIVHTHRSALAFARWAAHTYGLSPADRVTNHAPWHFDLSTFDLFASMLSGSTMVIIPEYLTKFPTSLAQLLAVERISVWYSAPFALMQLVEHGQLQTHDVSALRWILFAGEPFPTKHLRRLMALVPQARFSNLYGPTETNVCTYYHVDALPADSDAPIPIGRPCQGTETLVVDAAGHAVAPGDMGELLVDSPTLMRGYWGRPDLDARSLSRRTGTTSDQAVWYHTGDLVRQLPDGNYAYLGRQDRQIKLRGYRVELDEVEAALLTHDDVREAAVYIVQAGEETQVLAAVVIPEHDAVLTRRALLQHLVRQLPPYAVPTDITIMDDLPRTSTGKIDRRALQHYAGPHAAPAEEFLP
jgi:amino acid adenylation domain-containing protein